MNIEKAFDLADATGVAMAQYAKSVGHDLATAGKLQRFRDESPDLAERRLTATKREFKSADEVQPGTAYRSYFETGVDYQIMLDTADEPPSLELLECLERAGANSVQEIAI